MLFRTKPLRDYRIRATDDDIGSVKDIYFEDTNWFVRYIVVDTGSWLVDRRILLSPYSAGQPDPSQKVLPVNLTRRQVENSPGIEHDKPISRQHEHALHAYYGWPIYWGHPGVIPGLIPVPPRDLEPPPEEQHYNHHLRSEKEIEGYYIQALDGDIGHISDTIVDPDSWKLRYLVIDTGKWLPGRKLLIATDWVESFSSVEHKAEVAFSRKSIKESPEYDSSEPLSRSFEEQLYEHYGRHGYWETEPMKTAGR